jgi:hypothetical protein
MKSVKIFIQKDLTAIVVCPDCKKSKRLSVAEFKNKIHTVRVGCNCGAKFLALLEFRNNRRRRVNLKGTFRTYRQDIHREGKMIVSNISGGGLMCQVSDHKGLEQGHILSLNYNLDDLGLRKINKLAIIRHTHGITIGCEFVTL